MNRSIRFHRRLGTGWLAELVLRLHRTAETLKHLSTGMGLILQMLFLHLVGNPPAQLTDGLWQSLFQIAA